VTAAALLATGLGTGLLAGGASCAAVQGGLLAGAVARRGAARSLGQEPGSGQEPGPDAETGLAPVAPVGVFLAGKLLSHAALGAALGAFGAALQPAPRVRAVLLLVAAALMVVFAAEMLGVRAVSRWVPRPPLRWVRLVRRSSRHDRAITPALLGLATMLVPCGVTLSMELLAVTSGSPLGGAAVMAGFVAGTAPLFAVLGYLLHASARIARGRLRAATGVVVVAVAAWTGSCRRTGRPPSASPGRPRERCAIPAPRACTAARSPSHPARLPPGRPRRVHVSGIISIIEEDAYCPDVMKQLAAVQGLLEGASRIMLRRHLETCVAPRCGRAARPRSSRS